VTGGKATLLKDTRSRRVTGRHVEKPECIESSKGGDRGKQVLKHNTLPNGTTYMRNKVNCGEKTTYEGVGGGGGGMGFDQLSEGRGDQVIANKI